MLFASQTNFLAEKYGMEKAVDMLIEAGYPAIDISMFRFDDIPFVGDYLAAAKRMKEKADAHGVKFVQAHAPFVGGSKYDKYMSECVPLLPRAIEFAGILEIPYIVIHPIQNGRHYGNEKKLFDMSFDFYMSLAPIAKQYGVKIAIENMWQYHPATNYICDDTLAPPEELCAMYDKLLKTDAFTVCLDIGHCALCGREPENMIKAIGGERIGCIHAHDVDYVSDLHTLPGAARLNWDKICKALADIGYKGVFTLEADSFLRGFPEEDYPRVARFMADTARMWAEKIEEYKTSIQI